MTEKQIRELVAIIDSLAFGEVVVKKEAHRIVVIKKTESIKLSE